MTSFIWKMAGAAAAVAAAGAAVVVADKLLKKQQDKIDEMIRADLEQSEDAAAEPAEKVEEPVAPAQPAEDAPLYHPMNDLPDDGPNVNPFDAAPAETPRTADGKIDVSKLCDPGDFQDWDSLGCRD